MLTLKSKESKDIIEFIEGYILINQLTDEELLIERFDEGKFPYKRFVLLANKAYKLILKIEINEAYNKFESATLTIGLWKTPDICSNSDILKRQLLNFDIATFRYDYGKLIVDITNSLQIEKMINYFNDYILT